MLLLLTSPWTSSGVSFAQYFEANCGYGSRPYIYMRPALDNTTAPLIKLNYDIVLNGAPSFHDGDSDYEKWGPIDWQYGRACTIAILSRFVALTVLLTRKVSHNVAHFRSAALGHPAGQHPLAVRERLRGARGLRGGHLAHFEPGLRQPAQQ